MSQTNIKITEENEIKLGFIKTLGIINEVDVSSKEKLINFSIKVAYDCAKYSDEKDLFEITSLKKTI